MRDLGTLNGGSSGANGINDAGQVVGALSGPETHGETHAFITGPNGMDMRDLGTLSPLHDVSIAVGINETGQVVGELFQT